MKMLTKTFAVLRSSASSTFGDGDEAEAGILQPPQDNIGDLLAEKDVQSLGPFIGMHGIVS
ncbi:MAG: hypothetical protein MZU95_05985 [Desulfomicrobium escambiense]|nr:hypothetical protein [Desulfomicrobium escambiense]